MFTDYLREQLQLPLTLGIDRSKIESIDMLTKILNDRKIFFTNDGTSTDVQMFKIINDRLDYKELMDTIYEVIPTVDIMYYGY